MKINHISPFNFKGAVLNINSFSDNHGNLDKLDKFYQSVEDKKDELFLDNKKGNQNVLLVAGDWFISGGTKGYKSKPDANSHFYQALFFNKFIKQIQDFGFNLKTYFVPGNHELDAGVDEFAKILKKIFATVLMTNIDFEESPALKSLASKNKVVRQDILEVDDDKNPNLKHKALFLGINPVNMPYYKKDTEVIKFINEIPKASKLVTPEDYKETFDETVKTIEKFKKRNPKGIVIVSSHTGVDFAQNLALKMGGENINLILNAHEHKDDIEDVSGVKIVNLNQNFNKYINTKFFIDDDGSLKSDIELTEYYPLKRPRKSPESSYFKAFYNRVFDKDLEKEYKIQPDKADVLTLNVDDVRLGNNYLANFVTDSILSEIQKTNPEIEIFGINASAIRTSLDTKEAGGANNLQMMNVLNGIVHDEASILKNEVSGSVLLDLILENLLFNEKAPERNPIMHYSGITFDKKALLEAHHSGKTNKYLSQFVKTTDNEPIDLQKIYTIANVEKYFKKSKNDLIHGILYKEAKPTRLNAKDLFIQFVNANKDNLSVKCDERIIN